MEKIAIVGPSGAGKTTLARDLSSTINKDAIYLDRLFWKRDWEKISRDDRTVKLQELIQEKQWIIEGTYINSSKLFQAEAADINIFDAADTIIFLNTHSLVCLLRIIKRSFQNRGRDRRRDLPEGCSDTLTVFRILKVLFFPLQGRIKLEMNLRRHPDEKVIRFRSAKEVQAFLNQPELYIQKHRHIQQHRQFIKKDTFLLLLEGFSVIVIPLLLIATFIMSK